MNKPRPDLSSISPEIRSYIETLEDELRRLKSSDKAELAEEGDLPPLKPAEPPTTINLITITMSGIAKRTPRHLYSRQRRGGMGVFDIDTPEEDPPRILVACDESQHLILFTSLARAFRLPVNQIPLGEVRARGLSITSRFALQPGETIAAALPDQAKGGVALVSERGMVRYLRHHVFGEYMRPGTVMFDPRHFGSLVTVCRTPGDGDLLIVTRRGKAIRFSEKLIPPQGGPGIRLDEGDSVAAVCAVDQDSGVFMADTEGRGTIRLMSAFNPNKSTGGSGKIAMNTDELVAAMTVTDDDDIFMISRLSKVIRFTAAEVPAKEGVVQGVNCMSLRADQVNAVTVSA